VINLRLKAPGSFWTRPMAECFLFLRAQLLSGRWEIVLNNLGDFRIISYRTRGPDKDVPFW
jgi:hypothetical protein